jgi:hypothetical protein
MLGYSAWFQGCAEEAERLFDESAGVEVPARTSSVNEPAQARKAFKSGHQAQALRILRSDVQELLATDYTDLAKLAAVEFVNMMAAVDRIPEAARILGYLAGTGGLRVDGGSGTHGRRREIGTSECRTNTEPGPDFSA